MATAAAAATATPAPAAGGGKKKLIIIGAVVALLLALAAGGAVFYMRAQAAAAAAAEEGEDGEAVEAPAHAAKPEKHGPPTFLPLDPFVVNLADREHERYAQIGVTLEVDDPKVAEELKLYMPAIRNGVIMVLAHKTAEELLSREGKEKLAAEIRREAVAPLGIEIEDEEAAADEAAAPKKKKKKKRAPHVPVTAVHFSSFIIQ